MGSPPLSKLLECRACPRLVHCMETLLPRKGLSRSDYWNRPVPGFGDPNARVCLVGLAPGAHGANRTGRPFTGDGAGDFMYPILYRAGFASQPNVSSRDDGLILDDLYITNAVKCLPPENKPLPAEFETCRPFLSREIDTLLRLKIVILLGQGAFKSFLALLKKKGAIRRISDYPFSHGALYRLPGFPAFIASYHTSRYNVQTGRITEAMFLNLLEDVRRIAASGENG